MKTTRRQEEQVAGSAVGEGGRCSCGGSGVPPALRSPDDPPPLHAQQSAWVPRQTEQPSERSGRCMDEAHRDSQEPGCGHGGLSKAATAGRRAETRWEPLLPSASGPAHPPAQGAAEPLRPEPTCPDSCPTVAPSRPAALGPETSAARLGVSTVVVRV